MSAAPSGADGSSDLAYRTTKAAVVVNVILVMMADIDGDEKHGTGEGEFATVPGLKVNTGFLVLREAENSYAVLDGFGNFDHKITVVQFN